MSAQPDKSIINQYQQTENELSNNLQMLNELFALFSDSSLSDEELMKRALPIVGKLGGNNPAAAKEIREVLTSGDQEKIKAYFEKEKTGIFEYLNNEVSQTERAKETMVKENSQRPDFPSA